MQQFKYYKCQKGKLHEGENLNYLCFEEQCFTQNQNLICSICEFESHSSHQIIPFKLIIQQIQEMKNQINFQSEIEDVLKLIQQTKKNQIELANSNIITIQTYFKNLVNSIEKFYSLIENQIKNHFQKYPPPNDKLIKNILHQQYSDSNFYLKDFNQIMKILVIDQDNQVSVNNGISQYKSQLQKKSEQLKSDLEVIQKYMDQEIQKIQEKISFDVSFNNLEHQIYQSIQNFQFDSKNKSNSIIITNNFIAHQTNHASSDERFITTAPYLSTQKKTQWGIKIIKHAGWIGLGFAHKQLIIDKQFKFNQTGVGHGAYMLSSNGYTWSHTHNSQNCKQQSFKFETNDIINILIDPIKNFIFFNKNGSQDINNNYKLDIKLSKTDQICIIANLCSPNDQVEILNKIQYHFQEN